MLILHTDPRAQIQCLAFSPSDSILAVAGVRYPGVGLYDLSTGKERLRFTNHGAFVTSLVFAPDGQTIASADRNGTVQVWTVDGGREVHQFHTWPLGQVCVAFSPLGDMLAAGCAAWWGSPAQVRRWNLADGRELSAFRGHQGRITALAYSPDGLTLATGSKDRTIRLWDATSGRERGGFAARMADLLRLIGIGNQEEELRAAVVNETEIRSLAFSPDGTMIAAATGWRATLWSVVEGKLLANLKDHSAFVDTVAFSPDGRTLATASRDGTVKFWDVSLAVAIGETNPRKAGKVAATYSWDLGKVYSVAFAPDGLCAAAGGEGGQVVVWDVDSW